MCAGPTASGKSALAAEIAGRRGGVIVNADALQVYGCWRVLTARPPAAEEALVPHHLYGHVGRRQDWSGPISRRPWRRITARPVRSASST